jgi:hypothetical protein
MFAMARAIPPSPSSNGWMVTIHKCAKPLLQKAIYHRLRFELLQNDGLTLYLVLPQRNMAILEIISSAYRLQLYKKVHYFSDL